MAKHGKLVFHFPQHQLYFHSKCCRDGTDAMDALRQLFGQQNFTDNSTSVCLALWCFCENWKADFLFSTKSKPKEINSNWLRNISWSNSTYNCRSRSPLFVPLAWNLWCFASGICGKVINIRNKEDTLKFKLVRLPSKKNGLKTSGNSHALFSDLTSILQVSGYRDSSLPMRQAEKSEKLMLPTRLIRGGPWC